MILFLLLIINNGVAGFPSSSLGQEEGITRKFGYSAVQEIKRFAKATFKKSVSRPSATVFIWKKSHPILQQFDKRLTKPLPISVCSSPSETSKLPEGLTFNEIIETANDFWSEYGFLEFRGYANNTLGSKIACHIILSFGENENSTTNLLPLKMVLSLPKKLDSSKAMQKFNRSLLHEFGHALGLAHTQHNINIPWEWNVEAIKKKFNDIGSKSSAEQMRECLAKKDSLIGACKMEVANSLNDFVNHYLEQFIPSFPNTESSNFDPNSILGYQVPKEFMKGDDDKKPDLSQLNLSPSLMDKVGINFLYPGRMRVLKNQEKCLSDLWVISPTSQMGHIDHKVHLAKNQEKTQGLLRLIMTASEKKKLDYREISQNVRVINSTLELNFGKLSSQFSERALLMAPVELKDNKLYNFELVFSDPQYETMVESFELFYPGAEEVCPAGQ